MNQEMGGIYKRKCQKIIAPFPHALKGKRSENKYEEFFYVMKQVKVNIPLLYVIKQVSTIIECKTLVEYKDQGCPTISITIEDNL